MPLKKGPGRFRYLSNAVSHSVFADRMPSQANGGVMSAAVSFSGFRFGGSVGPGLGRSGWAPGPAAIKKAGCEAGLGLHSRSRQ
jgi:hypothetical protein